MVKRFGPAVGFAGIVAALALAVTACGTTDAPEGKTVADSTTDAEATSAPADSAPEAEPASDAAPVDVCALFTPDDFAAVMGKPADPQLTSSSPVTGSLGSCSYRSTDKVSVVLITAKDVSMMLSVGVPVDGLGEKAHWNGRNLVIEPAGKPHFFTITVDVNVMIDEPASQDHSIAVAKIILGR